MSTLFKYYKRKNVDRPSTFSESTHLPPPTPPLIDSTPSISPEPPAKIQRLELIEDDNAFTRDPGLRRQIWKEFVDERDEIRKKYIKFGPYQPILKDYLPTADGKYDRHFQSEWFEKFPWLEYSDVKNKAYCFYCFLFETNPPTRPAFTVEGFQGWKRIGGPKCSFLKHMGSTSSAHMNVVRKAEDLMNPSQHIRISLDRQSKEVVEKNRLRLKTSFICARWLAFQSCSFGGHDESSDSENAGNFLELVRHTADHNERVNEVVLRNAPGNARYTSPMIQKELLNVLGDNVRNKIRKEIGDGCFCILVDEAQDVSMKEQMAIILRFVDGDGLVRERFFGIVSVDDTCALTLQNAIVGVLSCYDLQIDKMRGQGYDGASNMRGAWNGLQALFRKEFPCAYYVHCFAHQLQLALVSASRDVQDIWLFFSKLNVVVNIIGASPKRHTQLKKKQAVVNANKVEQGELETGRGLNQKKTLHRAGATRWSSHLNSVRSLIDLFGPSCEIVEEIWLKGNNNHIRSEAKGAYDAMTSFEFVFILNLLNEIMGITDVLCQALQQKSQDIVNAMGLVSTTKGILKKLRLTGWNNFFQQVKLFCEQYDIEIPDMDVNYKVGTRRSSQQCDTVTVKHHYEVDVFNDAIDFQLSELQNRFSESTIELFVLNSSFDPCGGYKSFNIDDICKLAEKYYPLDFDDIWVLRRQLEHYEIDIPNNPNFQNLSRISDLCGKLAETNKRNIYPLVDKLIRLVLTLPVSTASTERAFSAMKLVKTVLRNKMEDDYLEDCMILTIERKLAQ